MEHTSSSDAPAGRPFVHRGVVPVEHDPQAHYVLTDSLIGHPDGATLVLAGTFGPWQRRIVKANGRAWANGTFTLDSGETVDFTVFPDPYAAVGGHLAEGERRVVHVRLDRRAEPPMLNIRAINHPDDVSAAGTVLTDQVLVGLAGEAEAGYDPDQLQPYTGTGRG